jgi:hypothetical protein
MTSDELQRRFMKVVFRIIVQAGSDHPLRFLVNDLNEWIGRLPKGDPLSIQAGHVVGKFTRKASYTESFEYAKHPERLMIEDAWFNWAIGVTFERKQHVVLRGGRMVGGVPVEYDTLRGWMENASTCAIPEKKEQLRLILRLDTHSLERTIGWSEDDIAQMSLRYP